MGTQQQPLRSVTPPPAKHDEIKDDPNVVDDILSRELTELSFQFKKESQEEIHGVRCMATKETPELIRQSLDMLQLELDNVIPQHKKQAYLRSQQLGSNTNGNNNAFVNTDEFRLRFLRYEYFRVPMAADRMCIYLDLLQTRFGDYALLRPVQLEDFSKQELIMMRKGKYQFLPLRDRGGIAGRRIMCYFGDAECEAMVHIFREKIMMYMTWVAGNDVDTQRQGLVFIAWFDKAFTMSKIPTGGVKPHMLSTVRPCAIHVCTPDTPIFRFRRSMITMRVGQHGRRRLIFHLGDSVEIRYKLLSYGIHPDQVPITYAGKIKVVYIKQWVKLRKLIEKNGSGAVALGQQNDDRSPMSTSAVMNAKSSNHTLIESPYISDVIFRKGASLVMHPGNTTLRALIVGKAQKELMEAVQNPNNDEEQRENLKSNYTVKTRHFVSETISEIRTIGQAKEASGTGKACRFLVWNEGGWWNELSEEHEIYNRVDYIARGIRKTIIKNYRASSMFAAAKSATKRIRTRFLKDSTTAATEVATEFDSLDSSRAIQANAISADLPIQHQNGGTSIFRSQSQDNSIPVEGMLRCIKKRRMLQLTEGENADEQHDDSGISEDHCFGLPFNATATHTHIIN